MPQAGTSRPNIDDTTPGPPGLGEIVARLERRLAWYGLPQLSVAKIEIAGDDGIVATIVERGEAIYREAFDARTGALRSRVADRTADRRAA